MKKFIIFIICFVFMISMFPVANANFTDSFEVDSNIAYVISADEDATVIYNKGGNQKCDPGSLVKAVTAILVIENCDDFSEEVTASGPAIRSIESIKTTIAGIYVDEVLTVENLLYCLLIYNASDAAVVLAEHIGGSVENFVKMMNDLAKELGAENTNFVNPGGYSMDGQYSTAEDIAKIYNYCVKNATFRTISAAKEYYIAPTNKYRETRNLWNTNSSLYSFADGSSDYYYEYIKCGKSGSTSSGTGNLVSFASKDGYNYISVVVDAPEKDYDSDGITEDMEFVTTKQLLKWIFENIKLREVANTTTYVGEVKVRLAENSDFVGLVPKESIKALVPSGVNAESVFIEPIAHLTKTEVDAPVKKGDILGRAEIKYAGSVIAEVDLVASADVELSTSKFIIEKIKNIITGPMFLIIGGVIVFIVAVLFIISYTNKRRLRNKRMRAVRNNTEKRG